MHTHSFQYYLPVNLIFGPGKTELLGEEAVRYGKRFSSLQDATAQNVPDFWTVQSPCLKKRGLR